MPATEPPLADKKLRIIPSVSLKMECGASELAAATTVAAIVAAASLM